MTATVPYKILYANPHNVARTALDEHIKEKVRHRLHLIRKLADKKRAGA